MSEIEINCVDLAGIDDFSVGACFGSSECFEEVRPALRCDLADMLDYAKGASDAALHFLGEVAFRAEKVGVVNLKLPNFVEVGGGDATTRGTTGFAFLDVDAVILPGEVKQAVAEVRDEATLVDR